MENENLTIDNSISKESHPMERVWFFKPAIIASAAAAVIALFGYISYELIIILLGAFFYNFITARGFEYKFSDDLVSFKHGFIKKRELIRPYQDISSVEIKRDWFDSIFGISRLTINFEKHGSDSTEEEEKTGFWAFMTKQRGPEAGKSFSESKEENFRVGFNEKKVSIPGLRLSDASEIKNFIEKKRKGDLAASGVINESVIGNSASGISVNLGENVGATRKVGFSSYSLFSIIIFVLAVVSFFINSLFAVFVVIIGIIFGIIGTKTKKRGLAVTGIIVNIIALIFFLIAILAYYFLEVKRINPFTGVPLTAEELREFEIE